MHAMRHKLGVLWLVLCLICAHSGAFPLRSTLMAMALPDSPSTDAPNVHVITPIEVPNHTPIMEEEFFSVTTSGVGITGVSTNSTTSDAGSLEIQTSSDDKAIEHGEPGAESTAADDAEFTDATPSVDRYSGVADFGEENEATEAQAEGYIMGDDGAMVQVDISTETTELRAVSVPITEDLNMLLYGNSTVGVDPEALPIPPSQITEMGLVVFEQRVKVSNRYDSIARDIELRIMLMPDDLPGYQYIFEERIWPECDRIEYDAVGNRYAVVVWPSLRPGEAMQVILTYNIVNTNWSVDKSLLSLFAEPPTDPIALASLSPEPYIESDHSDMVRTARLIVGDETNPYLKAEKLFNWVNTVMNYDEDEEFFAHQGALSALYTLRGVCTEYASLLVALLRAEGIPARLVAGFFLPESIKGSRDRAFWANDIAHTWVEFYLEGFGWLPCEPSYELYVNRVRMPATDCFAALPEWGHLIISYAAIDNFFSSERFRISYTGFENMLTFDTPSYLQMGQRLMDHEIKVYVDNWDKRLGFNDQQPRLLPSGVTMVPMRRIYELYGAQVEWLEEEEAVVATLGGCVVTLRIGEPYIWIDDMRSPLIEAPYVDTENRTMIPLRAVSEGLGAEVAWDGELQRVLLIQYVYE